MKEVFLFLISFCISYSCNAQERNLNRIEFLKIINDDYVNITKYSAQFEEIKREMVCPFYEYEVSEIEIGSCCLYALSKKYPESWIEEAKKGECATRNKYYGSLRCQAKQLLTKDTLLLKKELDIYLFFIDKKELEEPFRENVEGGIVESYIPKKGGNIYIYKYNKISNEWKLVDTQKNVNGETPRIFGEKYIEKIAIKRINDSFGKEN